MKGAQVGEKGFYVPVLTFLTLASVVLLVRNFPDLAGVTLCETARCTVQDWLSATSGWVGFGVASIGAYFVYHQLAEQRKQTAFTIGDGLPSFEIVRRSRNDISAAFRLTNWNRRSLVIAALRINSFVEFVHPIGIRSLALKQPEEVPATDYILLNPGGVAAQPRVSGWLDRQKTPWTVTFLLLFAGRNLGPAQEITANIPATIELDLYFAGEPQRQFTLQVKGELADFLPCKLTRGSYFVVSKGRNAKK
jgi:SOS-response transcriptional repressor LexA